MDSNTKKKLGVIAIVLIFAIYGLSIIAFIFLVETPTAITVTYSVVMLVFIVLLSYEGWQRLKEIEEGLEDAVDDY